MKVIADLEATFPRWRRWSQWRAKTGNIGEAHVRLRLRLGNNYINAIVIAIINGDNNDYHNNDHNGHLLQGFLSEVGNKENPLV